MQIVPNTSTAPRWDLPPARLILGSHEVHVWRAALEEPPESIERFLSSLSADEQLRANRFYFQRDREHFIIARGVLRGILGLYLNRAPECLSFRYGSHGKPALDFEYGMEAIHFNISHSHGMALYGITRGRDIGIDLEFVRRDLELEEIAKRFFSSRETATLGALPTDSRKIAFFLCWTRKEAYIKARGEGLSLPLDQFDVSLIPGEPAVLLSTRPDSGEANRWSLQELAPAVDYAAALAIEGRDWSLSRWQWPRSS